MSYFDGCWHYQDQAYATLREALLAAWPEIRKEDSHGL